MGRKSTLKGCAIFHCVSCLTFKQPHHVSLSHAEPQDVARTTPVSPGDNGVRENQHSLNDHNLYSSAIVKNPVMQLYSLPVVYLGT